MVDLDLDLNRTFKSFHFGLSLFFLTAWFEVAYYPIARDLKTLTIPLYTE